MRRKKSCEKGGSRKVGQGKWGERSGARKVRREKRGEEKSGARKVSQEKWCERSGARKVRREKLDKKIRA